MTQFPPNPDPRASRLDDVIHDYLQKIDAGETPDRAALVAEHPDLASELTDFFADLDRIGQFAVDLRSQSPPGISAPSIGPAQGGLPSAVRYFGRYEILQEIARGGMGVVYKARQAKLDRVVALKMILSGRLASSADVSRFYAEAQAAARLEHPLIVPIYEVGQFAGQHYFSMAYVDGPSLAARLTAGPLPPRDAAAIVEQLCRAVHYAHSQGVIHRDLKPANVLLDRDGRPKITDFGLAKQLASADCLTITGEVLGTPSFMPPEQSGAMRVAVGPAADVYSLGAILYAALTGRPPFQAATPADTLDQLRNSEPASPRLLNPVVNKDLETICLKCLEKDPQRRYPSAEALADDLQRFLNIEPIHARRIGTTARGMRWLYKRRRTATTVVASAAAAIVVIVAGYFGYQAHERSLRGSFTIATDGPSMVGQVLDASDQPVAPSFPVPMSQPVELPHGSYRIRLSAAGSLSQDYSLQLDGQGIRQLNVRLDDRNLWPAVQLAADDLVEPVSIGGRTDLLIYRSSAKSLRLIDGKTGKPRWPQELVLDKSNLPAGEPLEEWTQLLIGQNDSWDWSRLTIAATPHARGDTALIFASPKKPALVAVSSQTGKVLWLFRGHRDLPPGGHENDFAREPILRRAAVDLGSVDSKDPNRRPAGRAVVCWYSPDGSTWVQGPGYVKLPAQVVLECVSLETGKSIWRYDLSSHSGNKQPWETVPWFLDAAAQPQIATISRRKVVISTIDKLLFAIDLETGKEAFPPLKLGLQADAPPTILDQADGKPVFIVGSGRKPSLPQAAPFNLKITAFSLTPPRQLWQAALDQVDFHQGAFSPPNREPEFVVESLGPHGQAMIVAPAWSYDPSSKRAKLLTNFPLEEGRIGLAAFDAATGKQRWQKSLTQKTMPAFSEQIRWTVGPPISADGYRPIFVHWADLFQTATPLDHVVAIGGADGAALWRWSQSASGSRPANNSPLSWWAPGADGWPKLVVPIASTNGGQPETIIFDPANGRAIETIAGASDTRSADLSGSGVSDLFYSLAGQGNRFLTTVRGQPPTAWRTLNDGNLCVANDFNGDGIADVLSTGFLGPRVLNGADGAPIWQLNSVEVAHAISAMLPVGGGGKLLPTVVTLRRNSDAFDEFDMRAFAGADGHQVWPARGESAEKIQGDDWITMGTCVLNPARPDVWMGESKFSSRNPSLKILAGDTGRLRFETPIMAHQFDENGKTYPAQTQDLDGDGVSDLVIWAPSGNAARCQLKAFSGANFDSLWTTAPPVYSDLQSSTGDDLTPPTAGHLDGPSSTDVVFTREFSAIPKSNARPCELVAVDGKTGTVKWIWRWLQGGLVKRPPLLVDFDGSGRASVCVYIDETPANMPFANSQPQVVVLDGKGKIRRRFKCKMSPPGSQNGVSFYYGTTWWRKAAIGSGGKECLIFYDGGALRAIAGDKLEPLWSYELPDMPARIKQILSGDKATPDTVALAIGNSIFGLSSATGKPIWRGESTTDPSTDPSSTDERIFLSDSNPGALPRLLTPDGCRLLWPTDSAGHYKPSPGVPRTYTPLPGAIADASNITSRLIDAICFQLQDAICAFLWIVVPLALIWLATARRSWQLAILPAMYQIGAVVSLNFLSTDWFPGVGRWAIHDPHEVIALLTAGLLFVHVFCLRRQQLATIVGAVPIYVAAAAMAWAGRSPDLIDTTIGQNLYVVVGLLLHLPVVALFVLPAIIIFRRRRRRLLLLVLVLSLAYSVSIVLIGARLL